MKKKLKKINWFNIIFIIIIISGVFFSIYQFIYNRNLWLDEARLALNIVNKSFNELFQPLEHKQVAPIGFLLIEKIFANIFGNTEYSMRILPLLSFCLSIPFFFLLSKKLFKSNIISLIATAFFSINQKLIYFSSELKQYSIDVFLCILILYLTLNFNPKSKKSIIGFAILGIISIWFSNIAIILLFTCGLYSVYKSYKTENKWKIFLPIITWIISFSIYYSLFIYKHPTREIMTSDWNNYFLPINPFTKEFYIFFYRATKGIFSYCFSLKIHFLWLLPAIISFLGTFYLIMKKKTNILYILFAPIIVHLLLSSLKIYPFHGRIVLYLIPILILLFSLGNYYLWKLLNKYLMKASIFIVLIPIIFMYYQIIKIFPIEREEIKPCMAYLEKNIAEDDKIYIYYDAIDGFNFYKNSYPKLVKSEKIVGNVNRKSWDKYVSEILKLKGVTWLLFSHVYPSNDINNEKIYIINTLKKYDFNISAAKKTKGSSLYKISN